MFYVGEGSSLSRYRDGLSKCKPKRVRFIICQLHFKISSKVIFSNDVNKCYIFMMETLEKGVRILFFDFNLCQFCAVVGVKSWDGVVG